MIRTHVRNPRSPERIVREQPIWTGRGEELEKDDQLAIESFDRAIFHNESLTDPEVEFGSDISRRGSRHRPMSNRAVPN